MIYFYYGDDTFRAKETIWQLKDKFIKLYDPSSNNVDFIDGDEFSLERFFTVVKAQGFLAKKKFVIVKNIFSVKKFSDIQDLLIDYLKTQKNSKEENYIIFWQEGVPKQNLKLFKYLSKLCTPLKCCKNFEPMKQSQLITWIQNQVTRSDKNITKDAAELLISLVGDNTWHLYHEIQKLCNYSSKENITADDIQDIIQKMHADTIFTLMDAMSARQKERALALLEDYFQRETDRQYLLNMIFRQFRLIFLTKAARETTNNSYAIAQRLKLHPFVAKKMLQHSSNFGNAELESIYKNLIALDSINKSDPAYIETALTLFVARL